MKAIITLEDQEENNLGVQFEFDPPLVPGETKSTAVTQAVEAFIETLKKKSKPIDPKTVRVNGEEGHIITPERIITP